MSLARICGDMISRPPEAEGLTKLEDIALALDAYDKRTGWTEDTQMQDDLRRWSEEILSLTERGEIRRVEPPEGKRHGAGQPRSVTDSREPKAADHRLGSDYSAERPEPSRDIAEARA